MLFSIIKNALSNASVTLISIIDDQAFILSCGIRKIALCNKPPDHQPPDKSHPEINRPRKSPQELSPPT